MLGKELVMLMVPGAESGDWPYGAVVFQPVRNLLREIEADLSVGRELESVLDALTMKRTIESRIERHVPAPCFLVDDRTIYQVHVSSENDRC